MTIDWLTLPGLVKAQIDLASDGLVGWGNVVMAVAGITLVLVLAAVAIWQIFKTAQTRMTIQAAIAQDRAFRELAERATASREATAAETARIAAGINEISVRVAAIEKLLREVE